MAITINVSDANNDGKGIDFAAYLASYNKTFTRSGYGSFNSTDPMAMSGTQYSTNDANKYGVVLTAGKAAWNYNFMTHKVSGSLDAVEFGNSVALNTTTGSFDVVSDVKISGLNVTDTTLGGQILSDIMGGKATTGGATTSLVKILNANSIVFNGSTGKDVFTGYARADNISGGAGNDILSGAGGNDKLFGGAGNDRLIGGAGNDTLTGDAGNDYLLGGAGGDKHIGGAGIDTVSYTDATKGVVVSLGKPSINTNDAKGDTYSSIENLTGSKFNDTLVGSAGSNKINGYHGNDKLTGGTGYDDFVFAKGYGKDTITDFKNGVDDLDLTAYNFASANSVLSKATQVGDDVQIKFSATDIIILENFKLANLDASDFLL
jgi:serralysin